MAADFQAFQRAFALHLRDPHHSPRPTGMPARRAAIYRELVFNNLRGFLDTCFPVCHDLLGETAWGRLMRAFLRDWPLHTPWFHEIPLEFVSYLGGGKVSRRLPAWFVELGACRTFASLWVKGAP